MSSGHCLSSNCNESFPKASPASREQKGSDLWRTDGRWVSGRRGGKENAVDNLGRVLMREARGLGVADRVMRHSASLTDLARHGVGPAVRKELIATQADVEQAVIGLHDQKMAHLISLGGWLRGLEISAGAIELDFRRNGQRSSRNRTWSITSLEN